MNKKHTIILCIVAAVSLVSLATSLVMTNAASAADCGNYSTSVLPCSDGGNGVWDLLLLVINILTGGIFVVAVGGLIYASVLYTSAGGNQDQVKKSRTMITNVVTGIILFALMYALLQWLIPGGIFDQDGNLNNVPSETWQAPAQ